MSSKKNITPPNNSADKETDRKIPEESLSITNHPGATSTPTYMTRKRQRLLSLQMDSALSLSLVDRVPQTFEDIRGRKGIRDASSPKTGKLPRTKARNIPKTPARVSPSINHGRNSAKPKTPAKKKTTEKTPAKTPTDTPKVSPKNTRQISPNKSPKTFSMMQNVPAKKSPIKSLIKKPKTPAVKSPIEPIILPTESQLKSPIKLSISPTKSSMMSTILTEQSVKSEKNSPEAHFSGEVTNKENAAEEDISETPSKQPRLHILQVNLGSPFAMTHSKKLKVIAVDSNDENHEAKEAPPDNLSEINTSEEMKSFEIKNSFKNEIEKSDKNCFIS